MKNITRPATPETWSFNKRSSQLGFGSMVFMVITTLLTGPVDGNASDDRPDGTKLAVPIVNIQSREVDESVGTVTVEIALSEPAIQTCELTVWSQPGSATPGSDFYGTSQRVVFDTSASPQTVAFTIIDDEIAEEQENFIIGQGAHSGCAAGTNATLTINDDDGVERPEINVGSVSVNESDGQISVPVTLSEPASGVCSVTIASRDGSAVSPQDYIANSERLEFAAGETQKTVTYMITGDTVQEPEESFQILQTDVSENCRAGDNGVVTIADDDDIDTVPLVKLTREDINESAGVVTLTASMSVAATRTCTFTVWTQSGSAKPGQDYFGATKTLEIPAGRTEVDVSFVLIDDSEVEGVEQFSVGQGLHENCEGGNTGTVNILDDEGGGLLTIHEWMVDESESEAVFDIERYISLNSTCTVTASTQDGTAVAGEDFQASQQTITFQPGETMKQFKVPIINDTQDEVDEEFYARLSNATGACRIEGDEAKMYLWDDDNEPDPIVNVLSTTHIESTGTLLAILSVDDPLPQGDCVISVSTESNTAIDGEDYIGVSESVTIPAEGAFGYLRIPLVDDDIEEVDETFNLRIDNVSGPCVAGNDGVINIVDDDRDSPPVFQPEQMNRTTYESNRDLQFRFSFSERLQEECTFRLRTIAGTATDGNDYRGWDDRGDFVFTPPLDSVLVFVRLVDDDVDEPVESFTISQTLVSGNCRQGSDVTVNIVDR